MNYKDKSHEREGLLKTLLLVIKLLSSIGRVFSPVYLALLEFL